MIVTVAPPVQGSSEALGVEHGVDEVGSEEEGYKTEDEHERLLSRRLTGTSAAPKKARSMASPST
jgi:hypothetical protein